MKRNLPVRLAILCLSLNFILPVLHAQTWPEPELPDTTGFGRMLSRTMYLLGTSTPEKRNTVRVLVYGQSISEQDWWLEVRKDLQSKFPNADLVMENRAIGGFSSQFLKKTVRMDVESFYPDLVLFHVYGSHIDYETIIRDIRSNTTAEVAIQTDHYTGANDWSDQMSYTYLPGYAEKYGCELLTIRQEWIKYLDSNNLQPSELLRDGVHLNDYGNFLMAELIKPYLNYKGFKPDSFNMVNDYLVGTDVDFDGDTLVLPFDGNRVDLVAENTGFTGGVSARVLIDDHKPSDFQGTYYYTRPSSPGRYWPWNLGTWVETEHIKPLAEESWTLTYTSADIPFDNVSFEVSGSVTGYDGAGNTTEDFAGNSGKVLFRGGPAEAGDWHIKRTYDVTGSKIFTGQEVHWDVYTRGIDNWKPLPMADLTLENASTVIQGIDNNHHVLKIVKNESGELPLKAIRVYRPMWNRNGSYHLEFDLHEAELAMEGDTFNVGITSNSVWDIIPGAEWLQPDIVTSSGNTILTVSAGDNTDGYDREAYVVIKGIKGLADSIRVFQPGGSVESVGNSIKDHISLFPNPASDNLTIRTGQTIDLVTITDVSGRLMKTVLNSPGTEINIDISSFPGGVYLVRIKNENRIFSTRFVKMGR